jgi:hypothetical protein
MFINDAHKGKCDHNTIPSLMFINDAHLMKSADKKPAENRNLLTESAGSEETSWT